MLLRHKQEEAVKRYLASKDVPEKIKIIEELKAEADAAYSAIYPDKPISQKRAVDQPARVLCRNCAKFVNRKQFRLHMRTHHPGQEATRNVSLDPLRTSNEAQKSK